MASVFLEAAIANAASVSHWAAANGVCLHGSGRKLYHNRPGQPLWSLTAKPTSTMNAQPIQMPQYPAPLGRLSTAADRAPQAERLRKSQVDRPQQQKLRLGTYNARSLLREHQRYLLIDSAAKIKYNVICLQETKTTTESHLRLNDGSLLALGKRNSNSVRGGMGFLIHKTTVANIKSIRFVSDRLAILILTFGKIELAVFNVYAPTSAASEDDHETFYEDLTTEYRKIRTTHKIIVGDFNAKVGKQDQNEPWVGSHGYGLRNEQGNRLIEFCADTKLYHMNSRFQKKASRKWTWKSPNGQSTTEIDHFLTNHPFLFEDVDVVGPFHTGSDHRLVRSVIRLNYNLGKKRCLELRTKLG